MINIIIAERNKFKELYIDMLKRYDINIMGLAGSLQEISDLLKTREPDVLLIDIGLIDERIEDALNNILEEFRGTKIIILSIYGLQILAQDSIRYGAKGYYERIPGGLDELVDTIKKVHNGEICIPDYESITH